MPIGSGEYRPGDIVEAATIYNAAMQNPNAAEQLDMNLSDALPENSDIDVGALSRRDWPTTSVFRYVQESLMPSDPNWKQPFEELPPSHYAYRKMYEDADSPMKWQRANRDVEQEIQDNKMFSQMGVADWAHYMGVQMIDPISVALAIGTGSIFTMGKGVSVGQAALKTGALAAGEAAAIESVLQLTDPLRTIDESILSTIAGGVFGAFLGGGGQRVYNMWKGQSPEPFRAEIHKLIRDEVDIIRAENALNQTDTLTFKAYHGSPEKFKEWDLTKINPNDPDDIINGIWVTTNKREAEGFARFPWGRPNANEPNLYGVDIGLKKPASRNDVKAAYKQAQNEAEAGVEIESTLTRAREILVEDGFDGFIRFDKKINKDEFIRTGKTELGNGQYIQNDGDMGVGLYDKDGGYVTGYEDLEDATDQLVETQIVIFDPKSAKITSINETPIDFDEVADSIDQLADAGTQDPNVIGFDVKSETPKFSPLSPLVTNRLLRSAQTIMLYQKEAPAFSRFADQLSSNNIYKHGDFNGTRYNGKTLAQEIKKTERRMLKTAIDETTTIQKALKAEGIKITRNGKNSVDDIAKRIGQAARNAGKEFDEHQLIKEAGLRVRKQFDDWKERGIKSKVLSKEAVDEMDNYLPRLWDMEEVARRPLIFRQKIGNWLSEKHPEMDEGQIAQAIRDIKDSLHRINNGETHAIEYTGPRRLDPKSGHAKSRRLTMKDDVIQEFLVSDIRILNDRYARTVGSDIIVREIFGADNITDVNGLPMPKAQYQAGLRQFDEAIEALENTGTKSALRKAERLRKKRDLTAEAAESFLRQILRRPNTPGGTVRSLIDETSRQLRGYAGSSQLGMVVASAMPDPANNVLQHGMANVLLSLPEFFKTLPVVLSRTPVSGRRATVYRDMDIALDNMLNTRMEALADVDNMTRYGMKRKFFHGGEVARKAFRIFLADRWNTAVKLFAATVSETAVIRAAPKFATGKLGKFRTAKMRRMGMTEESATRLADNIKIHGKRRGLLNYDKWDREAYNDMQSMLWRESEYQVVAPDAGEMPELFNSEVGKLFLQYKTFILSHTMKQMIPATQRLSAGDLSVLAGMTTMVSLGIFSQYVKDISKSFDKDVGFDIDEVNKQWANKTPMDLAGIGINNSGVMSYIPGLLSGLDNFFNNELGESIGMTPRKRTYSPGGLENQAAGLGYAYDLGAAAYNTGQAAVGAKDFTARDLNKWRRVAPIQNTFYLNWMFDWGQQTVVDQYNLPEKSGQTARLR